MAQFARPFADLDNTGVWTTEPLWSDIDDGDSPDGTVVVSDTTPVVTEPFTVDLSTLVDPALSTGHILRIRWAKNSGGGGGKTIRIELREGYVNESTQGTLIATDDYSINSTTLNTDETALSGAEADNIGDYSDLQIRVMGVASNRALKVDFVELEAPPVIVTGAGIGHGVASSGATATASPPTWAKYRPDSDEVTTGWTTTPLWSKIDDDASTSGGDSDVVLTTSNTTARVGLPTLSAPTTYVGWKIRIRARIASGTKTVFANLVRKSDGQLLSDNLGLVGLNSTFGWFEQPVDWIGFASVDIAAVGLDDFALTLDPNNAAGTVEVSAIELWVPNNLDGDIFGNPTSFSDIELPHRGKAGPWANGTSRYVIGLNGNWAWLWEATSPTDGHNAGEWTRKYPVAGFYKRTNQGKETVLAENALLSIDGVQTANGDISVVAQQELDAVVAAHGSAVVIDPTDGSTTFVDNTVEQGDSSTNDDVIRTVEKTADTGTYRQYGDGTNDRLRGAVYGPLTYANQNPTVNHWSLMDAISADDRAHIIFINAGGTDTGTARHIATTQGTVFGSESSDIVTSIARNGVGVAFDDGAAWQVVAPLPETDGSGIVGAVFQSADTPTIGTEQITTRDAYDAAYEQSAIALVLGPNVVVVVFLDDATSEAIYAASRSPGTTTWIDEGQQVASIAGRTRMSAVALDSSTIGVIVAATTGDIFYYEFQMLFAAGAGHGTARSTATATVVEPTVEAVGHAVTHGTATGSVVGVVSATALGHATPSGTVTTLGSLIDATATGHGVSSGLATGDSIGAIDATAISYAVAHGQTTASVDAPGDLFTGWGIPA